MTAATLDLDTLDKLFDNQKKLDDIFSSIFDDGSLDSSPMSFDDGGLESLSEEIYSYDDLSYTAEDTTFVPEKRSIAHIIMPVVLEIAAIYYGIVYFF